MEYNRHIYPTTTGHIHLRESLFGRMQFSLCLNVLSRSRSSVSTYSSAVGFCITFNRNYFFMLCSSYTCLCFSHNVPPFCKLWKQKAIKMMANYIAHLCFITINNKTKTRFTIYNYVD